MLPHQQVQLVLARQRGVREIYLRASDGPVHQFDLRRVHLRGDIGVVVAVAEDVYKRQAAERAEG